MSKSQTEAGVVGDPAEPTVPQIASESVTSSTTVMEQIEASKQGRRKVQQVKILSRPGETQN